MRIPVMYLRDKQAFRKEGGAMRLAGKPLNVAKAFKEDGVKLIHIVDIDALSGLRNNLDVYDNLTFIINVQVECAPRADIVMKLLSLKCRVVLPPSFDASGLKEKKLLVAKIPKDYPGDAGGFHDVLLEDADDASVRRFHSLGKRVIVHEEGYGKLDAGCRKLVWGVISSS
ncbi:MAG: HisA/HisF-related TIM barrel protein [Candidatus Micrarchaeota archaeon]